MSKETVQFAARVRNTPPRLIFPQVTVGGQTAFMRECPACQLMTPHKLVDGGSECGVCGQFQIRIIPPVFGKAYDAKC